MPCFREEMLSMFQIGTFRKAMSFQTSTANEAKELKEEVATT
jgi:hypothetical protein